MSKLQHALATVPPLGRQAWCVWCQEFTPVEYLQVDDPDVPECRHCGATDITPKRR